ncbi:MAG TPA: hypothetical protein VM529_23330, partial [Gemmata sp.]|nr:hypothetical protein [Gemmata sp.]
SWGLAAPADPKAPRQDPNSGSEAKPATEKKDGDAAGPDQSKPNPAEQAGTSKPNVQPDRGAEKPPQPGRDPKAENQPTPNPDAAAAKPEKAPPSGEAKPMPKDGMAAKDPAASEEKPQPDKSGPKGMGDAAAEPKPEPKDPTAGMPGDQKPVEKGTEKPQPSDQNRADGDAGGMDKKDGSGARPDGKVDEKTLQEIKDAAADLGNPDPGKQQAARDKLDKMVGKDNREAIEKLQKEQKQALDKLKDDLQSKDEATRQAAEKQLEDLRKQAKKNTDQAKKDAEPKRGDPKDGKKGETGKNGMDGKGEGKEQSTDLSEQELRELLDLARDLTSEDEQKRKQAEQALDDKLGKAARERIQDEIRKRIPREEPPAKTAETDPRNKARAAQLQLEEFERQRNGAVPENLKWTDKEYEEFLAKLRERAERLGREADKHEEAMRNSTPTPTLTPGGAEKVDERANVVKPDGVKAGSGLPPPGFNDALDKFRRGVNKIDRNR